MDEGTEQDTAPISMTTQEGERGGTEGAGGWLQVRLYRGHRGPVAHVQNKKNQPGDARSQWCVEGQSEWAWRYQCRRDHPVGAYGGLVRGCGLYHGQVSMSM